MGRFLSGFLLPTLLLTAALLNWSLMSLADLLAFLFIQYSAPKIGAQSRRRYLVSWYILGFSLITILSHAVFHVACTASSDEWSIADAQWAKVFGFLSDESWSRPYVVYFLTIQVLSALVAMTEICWSRMCQDQWQHSLLGHLHSSIIHIGSVLRVFSCLLLPAVQLAASISHPSWASLPFFICSSIGLVNWSLTSNFLGLFQWWRYLLVYAGLNIVLLYAYQLPIEFCGTIQWAASIIGLYKISVDTDWSEIFSGISLLIFYVMLSWIRCDLMEMDLILSTTESRLTEQLLPRKHSFIIRESRSGVRNTNFLLRGSVFRTFSVNFFTYGFPISLLALASWSFQFASLCAFGLLAYVGYILFAFPSVFRLHRLNGLLLVFILLWAASTYIFNVLFTVLNKKMGKDKEVWEAIGLWHYPIPAFYLLAQFFLGVLVALGNLVNNSVLVYLSDGDKESLNDDSTIEDSEETKVLIVATIAWGLRKSSRAVTLVLIFLIALKPGFVHALYMCFCIWYLLSHNIGMRIRKSLILLCEAHFGLLYILQLSLISEALKQKCSVATEILSKLGFLHHTTSADFFKIAALACTCAIHNHGFGMLFSFSAIVEHTPSLPIGFSILRAGLIKSVILSVYTSRSIQNQGTNSSHENKIASYLRAVGRKFLMVYRSCGTSIASLTILLMVYLVRPNFISLGYLFFLLVWLIGRQLVGRTKRRLWLPLKLYAVAVFILIYGLGVFFSFRTWLSKMVDISSAFGYNPEGSMLDNIWESLAVLVVMQLYSYERRKSKYSPNDSDIPEKSSISFLKRLLILHSEKILNLTLFYASLSPISVFGFIYLFGLIFCSTLPKTSGIPSKLSVVYSGLLVIVEFVFQLCGGQAEMLPGQKYSSVAFFLGLQLYKPGFWGLESGLRAKVFVIVACILRYNVYRWMEMIPCDLGSRGKWGEPCSLFGSSDKAVGDTTTVSQESRLAAEARSQSWPSLTTVVSNVSDTTGGYEGSNTGTYPFIYGGSKENQKWDRKRILSLRKERLEIQKTTLKAFIKFWIENTFNLFGLEVMMIGLLLASFAVLNFISLLYVASLATCILLPRNSTRKLWPIFLFLFGSVITLEYLAMWWNLTYWKQHAPDGTPVHCNDCWRSSDVYYDHCKKCWLGILVDDPRMLTSYFVVFILACFKFRADHFSSLSASETYKRMIRKYRNASLDDLSFERKSLWTYLDYLRLYSYCHLLDLVLSLILVTGTLEFDILHLGYLGFALIFFRIRFEILKKKHQIFKFLRMYNFAVIVLSLAYQSPFLGGFCQGKCGIINLITEVIGFHKYDYGFRITSRSALVEIIIFLLVSMQSYMFSAQEFDYVSQYIEAEQIGNIVHEQEKRAAWKTEQLQQIRKSEEQKRLRNLQVENMKLEMLNLQNQLHNISTFANCGNVSQSEGLRRRRTSSLGTDVVDDTPGKRKIDFKMQSAHLSTDLTSSFDVNDSPNSERSGSTLARKYRKRSVILSDEIFYANTNASSFEFLESNKGNETKVQVKRNLLVSAVNLLSNGVSQAQSLGNVAVTNLVQFFNIKHDESDLNDASSEEDVYYEIEEQNSGSEPITQTFSVLSDTAQTMSESSSRKIGMILRYIWSQMRSNVDVVCYCFFVLTFLWNFSLLSMVYPAILFLYALCVNTGPNNMFWVIVLKYTEMCIALQYVYQIIIQHCELTFNVSMLQKLGFPGQKMSSFVIGHFPLILVYISTLLQTSITARDSDCATIRGFNSGKNKQKCEDTVVEGYVMRIKRLLLSAKKYLELLRRGLIRYWKSLTQAAETPPYFVQLSFKVDGWPEDGIQPERIRSGINKLLKTMHDRKEKSPNHLHSVGTVRVQSIERSAEDDEVGLAVLEVLDATSLKGINHVGYYKSLTPAADVAQEILEAQRSGVVEEIGFPYRILSVIGGVKKDIDLYAYMFCADLAVFFLVAIFYQTVMKNSSEFLEVYQHEDQFAIEFVFILMVIFFLIVLDRILYLCSFATGKVISYVFNIVLFTYAVTKYAWYLEPQQRHAGKLALCAIYLTKSISLAFQATQLRFGIPFKSTLYRQALTSRISQLNFLGFRLYRALPFLHELRCVLDWSCTTTSLTMYDWLKLEDIHASLFIVKCDVDLNRAKHCQGDKQTKMTKFCNGICLFFVLMCVIWAPMLMYSSGNPTNIANPIKDASIRIDIKTIIGTLRLFETTLCKKIPWDDLDPSFLDPQGYLLAYDDNDIQLICCQADASTLWLVPPVVQERYMKSLRFGMDIRFSWQLTRNRPKGKEVVKYELRVEDEDLPTYSEVMAVLNGSANHFPIYNVYPRYFRVTGSGEVRLVEQAISQVCGNLVLNRGDPEWWSFHDIDVSSGCGELAGPMAIIISEETPQGILGETLSKFSIWGLYITFVLAVGRFIRIQSSDLRMRIPFENLPSCDRLLAICEDLYTARAEGELEVEEVLYLTLVNIYRSPHMLREYTKPD